jgi:hypothetical protein
MKEPDMPISPSEYERATAIAMHATLKVSLDRAYPELTSSERDAMFMGVIERLARMRGFAIRREFTLTTEESDW